MDPQAHENNAVVSSRLPTVLFAAVLGGYGVLALLLSNAPLQDLPNHLTRAHIIADLLFDRGAAYGRDFHLRFMFQPYLLGDLILAALDKCFGTEWAARVWTTAAVLLLPLSAWFALHMQGISRRGALTGAVLSLYLATGWFFVMGFITYELGFACAMFAYGWFLRSQNPNRAGAYWCYVLFLLLGYAMHLSTVVFLCAIIGIYLAIRVLRQELPLRRALLLIAPPYLLLAGHLAASRFLVPPYAPPRPWPTSWGTVQSKLMYLGSPFVRFNLEVDAILLFAFLAVVALPFLDPQRRAAVWRKPPMILAMVCLAMYVALPSYTQNIYSVDVRALPYAAIFLVFASVTAESGSPATQGTRQLTLAVLLAVANLVWVATQVLPQNAALGRYKSIAASIPAGAHVLPVDTHPPIGRYRPFMHAGSYATLMSRALTPYLFAGDQDPPMAYFVYSHRDDAPGSFWYSGYRASPGDGPTSLPDWRQIRREFQYVLITTPWNPARIPLHYTIVRSNDSAALLRIDMGETPRGIHQNSYGADAR